MRTLKRTVDRSLVRDVGALVLAFGVVGVSFGAIAVAEGLSGWLTIAMSLFVFAGGAQFMAVGLLTAGNPIGAVLGGLLLNARHLPFGLAVGSATTGKRWRTKLLGSHLLVDESVAFALAQTDPVRRRTAFWVAGGALFVAWNAGTALGAALGSAVADPAAFGLDAAFPAGLFALLWPSLGERVARRVALLGATVALVATPLLPAGLPVLLAATGVAAALPVRRGQKPESGHEYGSTEREEATE